MRDLSHLPTLAESLAVRGISEACRSNPIRKPYVREDTQGEIIFRVAFTRRNDGDHEATMYSRAGYIVAVAVVSSADV